MGDRGQVNMADGGVWLYTHWGATNLPETVAKALAKELRWGDPEYLARVIFETMLENASSEETGYGIGSSQHGDVYRVVHVNCQGNNRYAAKTVVLEGYTTSDHYGVTDPSQKVYTFGEFIDEYGPE